MAGRPRRRRGPGLHPPPGIPLAVGRSRPLSGAVRRPVPAQRPRWRPVVHGVSCLAAGWGARNRFDRRAAAWGTDADLPCADIAFGRGSLRRYRARRAQTCRLHHAAGWRRHRPAARAPPPAHVAFAWPRTSRLRKAARRSHLVAARSCESAESARSQSHGWSCRVGPRRASASATIQSCGDAPDRIVRGTSAWSPTRSSAARPAGSGKRSRGARQRHARDWATAQARRRRPRSGPATRSRRLVGGAPGRRSDVPAIV
jgi:hypothetical protein